jgi:hypothetical protein
METHPQPCPPDTPGVDSIAALQVFSAENNADTKGRLSLLIQLTRLAGNKEFPLVSDDFLTANRGQVARIGGANLRKILKEHGISRTLASEGGRTSQGTLGLMTKYVSFLNDMHEKRTLDLKAVEAYWADRIREFLLGPSFCLTTRSSKSVAASLGKLLEQARAKERLNPGTRYLRTMLHRLVAAKLLLIMPQNAGEVRGALAADSPSDSKGDFEIGRTIIRCATTLGEAVITKCAADIRKGYQPIIITIPERVGVALDMAADAGIGEQVNVWDFQQFLSTNVTERGLFDRVATNARLADIIGKYNAIIDDVKADPSLRIELRQ